MKRSQRMIALLLAEPLLHGLVCLLAYAALTKKEISSIIEVINCG